SHRSYVLQAFQTQRTTGLGEDDIGFCMFALLRMGGWGMPLGYWANGGSVVLLEKADPGEILRTIERERVTYLYLIPTLYDAVLSLPDFARTDLSSLRALGSGTAVMTEAQIWTIMDRFRNRRLFIMYGQTEAGPVATLHPREVERCLLAHPKIAEAAVFGVPDPHWGEVVVAAVVQRNGGALTEAEVIEHVRSRLAGYKKPRAVHFVDALPRTGSTRQVQKTLL